MGLSCGLVPCEVFPEEPLYPAFLDNSSWSQRRVRLQKWAALRWCCGLGEALTSAINTVSQGLFLMNVSYPCCVLAQSRSALRGWDAPNSPKRWTVRGATLFTGSALLEPRLPEGRGQAAKGRWGQEEIRHQKRGFFYSSIASHLGDGASHFRNSPQKLWPSMVGHVGSLATRQGETPRCCGDTRCAAERVCFPY